RQGYLHVILSVDGCCLVHTKLDNLSFLFRALLAPLKSTLFPYTTLFRSSSTGTTTSTTTRSGDSSRIRSATFAIASSERSRPTRSEEHTSELQSPYDLVCRLLLEKKKKTDNKRHSLIDNSACYALYPTVV